MPKQDIDVARYREDGLLRIYQTPDPTQHPLSILDGFHDIVKTILANSKPPYRITGRISHDVRTEEGISVTHHFEELFHSSMFDNFEGSVLCTYELNDIMANDRWQQWLSHFQACHDVSIIQTSGGKETISFNNYSMA